jgi:hypothetical protein
MLDLSGWVGIEKSTPFSLQSTCNATPFHGRLA